MHTLFFSDENALKILFIEKEVTTIYEELAELREHVHKLMLVDDILAFHIIKQLHNLRMLGGHAA